jgi:heptosyltransferase-2
MEVVSFFHKFKIKNFRILIPQKLNTVLIIRLSSFGDVLLTSPMIRTLKEKYKNVKIDFLVREQYYDLLKLNPAVNQIFVYENDKKKIEALRASVIENKYNIVIDLQNNLRSRLLLRGMRLLIFRFNKHSIRKFLLVKFKINLLKNLPPIPGRYIQTFPGLASDKEGLEFYTDKVHSDVILNKSNLIGLCPGSRHFTKMWGKEKFITLGNILTENGFSVVLFGGKDDSKICSEISAKIEASINLCNNDNAFQTAADMKMCKAVVCNDSGLMHLASAVKVPAVVILGSTVKEFGFTPYKNKNIIIENNSLSCRPCSHIGKDHCPKGHFKCMSDISSEFVFENITKLLMHS